MSHDHAHHDRSARNKKRLTIVLVLTSVYMVAEVVGGLLTQSLALLADAAHMLTDVGGLALALMAMWFAEKPANPAKTYGYYRVEILAAMANAIVLIGVSAYIFYEAYERLRAPPEVDTGPMMVVAAIGLVVNAIGLRILHAGSKESLNMKGAYFEVLSDLLTSVGVLAAGAVMWATGWYYADAIVSAAIGLFIFPRTWRLLKEAVDVLLEGTPSDVNLATLRSSMETVAGVSSVHDLHVWSLTSGVNAMSAHVVLADGAVYHEVLYAVRAHVAEQFSIRHATIQVEPKGCDALEVHL